MQIEASGLDQDFGEVDAGEALVLRGFSLRDSNGYGLRATLGSRSWFEVLDPCHLVRQWELVQPKDDIPKVLKCGAAAQAISMSISALILLYDFGGFPLNYLLLEFISIYCVSYAQWYSVFVCFVAFGSSLLLNAS